MKYSKPHLSFEKQACYLLSRGLVADKTKLTKRLKQVNYYRLSGYWYPFLNSDDTFKPQTSVEIIWRRYTFDRELRLLLMDAIEKIEVTIRTRIAYYFSEKYGAFGYQDKGNLPDINLKEYGDFISQFSRMTFSSKELFVSHFFDKYGDSHHGLPIWMAIELMSFGMMLTFYKGLEQPIRKKIAADFGTSEEVFTSWLHSITSIRNMCAHHARLWNKEIGYKPKIPKKRKHPKWHTPFEIKGDRIFGMIMILKYLLKIVAPNSKWGERVEKLTEKYNDLPIIKIGFPLNWKDSEIWKA